MKAVGSVIGAPLKAIGLIPKMPKVPAPQKPLTRDDLKIQSDAEDELRRRKGESSNIITGTAGAEVGKAATGAATLG